MSILSKTQDLFKKITGSYVQNVAKPLAFGVPQAQRIVSNINQKALQVKPINTYVERVAKPLANAGTQYAKNVYIKSAQDIPQAYKQIQQPGLGNKLLGTGRLGLDILGAIPDPTDILFAGYDFTKGAVRGAQQKMGPLDIARAGIKAATRGETPSLGQLFQNQTVRGVADVAELPLLLAAGYTKGKFDSRKMQQLAPELGRVKSLLSGYDLYKPEDQIKVFNQVGEVLKRLGYKPSKDLNRLISSNPREYLNFAKGLIDDALYSATNPEVRFGMNVRNLKKDAQAGLYDVITQEGMKKVRGKPVKIAEGIDTFIHQGDNPRRTVKGFVVSEKTTGRYVGSGETERRAIQDAKNNINTQGVDKLKQALAKHKLESNVAQQPLSVVKKDTLPQKQLNQNISKSTTELVPSTTELKDLSLTPIISEKGKLNVKNLNIDDNTKKIVRTLDQSIPTVIGNKDVIESAKLTSGAKTAMTDEQMQELLAKRLNSRQTVVTLSREFEDLKKSGANDNALINKLSEIADQSKIAQQEGTLAGRQLQAQKILADELATPQQKVLALLDNAGVDKNKYLKDAVKVDWNNSKQVVDFYRKYVPPKFGEILSEFRYTNMLSSPLTHLTNIATNFFQSGVVAPVEKTISGLVDWTKSSITGSERKYYADDGIKYASGFYKSLPEAWKKFKDIISGREISIKPDMERIPTSTGGVYGAYTTPLRALEAADNFFMQLVKGGETASLQGRGFTPAQIALKADNSARYRLFRQEFDPEGKTGQGHLLKLWDKYNSVVNQLRRLPGGNWIVPFLQTPTNILKQGVEYSPLGIATLPGSKNKIEQLSKTIIGSTVFTGIYGLLNSTPFTWEVPKGPKERELFYAAGMQPYSIKIGDQWVSYSKLGPLSYPIAMAAALRYAEKYNLDSDKESKIGTAVGGMMKFFSDQSYVKQLGDFMDSVQTGRGIVGGLKMEASNFASQLIPYRSFLGWLSRMIDPVNRKSNTFTSSITSQLPFLSKTNEAYYNPITKQPSLRSNRFTNAFSPIRTTTGDKNIEQLYNYTGSAKRAYMNLKSLPKEQAADIFNKISKSNPRLASEINKIAREEVLGLTKVDKEIQNLGVADGERAYRIVEEFNKLETKEEKAALWEKYVKLKIINKDIAKQLAEFKKRGDLK